jgi:hypothetical protein
MVMTGKANALGDRRRLTRATVALMWLAAALLVLGVSPYWRIDPDSALYTGLARSIATGAGYTFSGETEASIPSVTPLYLALAYKAAHLLEPNLSFLATFYYFNAFTALAGMAGIVAAFFLIAEMRNVRHAVFVLFFLLTARHYFFYSIVPLTDVPYCALSWLALLFVVRLNRAWHWADAAAAAFFLTLAVLTRLVGISLVVAVAGYFLWNTKCGGAQRARALAAAAIVIPAVVAVAVELVLIFRVPAGSSFNYYADLAAGRSGAEIIGRIFHDLVTLPGYLFEGVTTLESVAGLGVIFTAIVLLGGVVYTLRRGGLALAYFVCYLLYVASGEEVLPMYVAPLLPLVYLFLIEAVTSLCAWAVRVWPTSLWVAKALRRAAVIAGALVIAANLVYVGREIALNFSKDFYASYRKGGWREYFDLAGELAKKPPRGRVMAYRARVVCALADVESVRPPYNPETRFRPSIEEIARYVKDRNVTAVVVDGGDTESSELLSKFIAEGPLDWKLDSSFGKLALYEVEGENADSPDSS